MSDTLGELGSEFENLKARIAEIEGLSDTLPDLQERMNEVAVLIKQYVSDPAIEPEVLIDEAAEPVTLSEPIQSMADLSGDVSKVDWQTGMIKPEAFNGLSPETD